MATSFLDLCRKYLIDWLFLLALIGFDVGLYFVHPFQRYVNSEILKGLMFPLKDNSVPTFAVPLLSLLLPIALLAAYSLVFRPDKVDFHQSLFGLFYAMVYMAIIVDSLKISLGRPRPNFFARCFPNNISAFQKNGDVLCNGDPAVIREGYKSFPSGHSSWSFCGLGYLSLQLAGKLQVFNGHGHISKFVVVFLPIAGATAVGVTRVDDYWHHWTDVVTGAIIGLVTAYICYRQLYPPLTDQNAGIPLVETEPRYMEAEAVDLHLTDIENGSQDSADIFTSNELEIRRSESEAASDQSKLPSRAQTLSGVEDGSLTSEQLRLQPMERILLGKDYLRVEKKLFKSSPSANSTSTS